MMLDALGSISTLTTTLGVIIPILQPGNGGLEMSKCLPEIRVSGRCGGAEI